MYNQVLPIVMTVHGFSCVNQFITNLVCGALVVNSFLRPSATQQLLEVPFIGSAYLYPPRHPIYQMLNFNIFQLTERVIYNFLYQHSTIMDHPAYNFHFIKVSLKCPKYALNFLILPYFHKTLLSVRPFKST